MVNINLELFKRYQPTKKAEIVKNLTTSELMLTRESTILRCIKEAGKGSASKTRSKFKTLYLSCRPSNGGWNSSIESVYNWKKDTLYISVYVQGDDTDTTVSTPINKLLTNKDIDICLGSFEESYLHGNDRIIHANYSLEQRAEAIREILFTYIENKYQCKVQRQ